MYRISRIRLSPFGLRHSDRQTMGRVAAIVLTLILLVSAITAYNIDTRHAVVRYGPNDDSYFGYGVAQYSDPSASWMIVGAPLDNITSPKLMNKGVKRPGTVYRCEISQGAECKPIIVDDDYVYNRFTNSSGYTFEFVRDNLDNGWLGSSISAVEEVMEGERARKEGRIIVCAPRYVDYSAVTYTRRWYPIGRCSVIDNKFKVLDQKLTPCKNKYKRSALGEGYCQVGESAKISEDGHAIVLGAPGAFQWQGVAQIAKVSHDGELFVQGTKNHEGAETYAYLGYSSDFANFNWKKDRDIYYSVAGAPRQNGYFGRVVVFELNVHVKEERIDALLFIPGTVFGAYFGHSVAAVDLNNDGFDDLLVGAPLYSNNYYDQGAVYVYMNDGKSYLEKSRVLLLGTVVGGRFGYAIAKARDLNADTFDDVVISAPYQDGGVIYIYHGSIGGITEQPLQVITAEDFSIFGLLGFGTSLSAGMDLDKNGYPDILVGAYRSDKAILLRSRPVVHVESKITAEPQYVNYPSETKFSVTVCLHYSGRNLPRQLTFDYSLRVDESRVNAGLKSRATFEGQLPALEQNLTLALDTESCEDFLLELPENNTIVDKFSPIVTSLEYQLANEGQDILSSGDPNITQSLFPVLKLQDVHHKLTQVYLLQGCGSDRQCVPDLRITSAFVIISGERKNSFVLGNITEITVVVSVTNDKENAFNARLTATFPREITLLSPNLCDHERAEKSTVTCSLGNPLRTQKTVKVELRMSVTELTTATTSFQVNVEAFSGNLEDNVTLSNNYVSLSIWTLGKANFGLFAGKAVPDRIGFDPSKPSVDVDVPLKTENQIGPIVTHSFTVLNNGPSAVSQSRLSISWPLFLRQDSNSSQSYLLYILDVDAPASVVCDKKNYKDPLGLSEINTEGKDVVNISHLSITPGRAKRFTKTFYFSSQRSRRSSISEVDCSSTACVQIQCQLPPFAKGGGAEIIVVSRLYERSLVKYDITELNISSVAVLEIPESPNLEISDGRTQSFHLTTRISQPTEVSHESLAAWVIIVAVIATLLLLIGVIALMRHVKTLSPMKV